ncbi:helix-turn-helix domain-containing protein [Paenibacillus sp. FSL L8-0709]|uniref:helix-turn-helix domain-containing protein n=1 Tax=Paenibacillus sp. FSL L8-0709 TaxID=2975312 RepID=UPI0030F7D345
MKPDFLWLTEAQINKAIKQADINLLHKEMLFILQYFIMNFSNHTPDVLQFIKSCKVNFRPDPEFLFSNEHISILKSIMLLSESMTKEPVKFLETKLLFDSWFYQSTTDGYLEYIYNPNTLINITEAAALLSVSRTMLYKYIEKGLEAVGTKGRQKIPKVALDGWKNPAYALQTQWNSQMKLLRTHNAPEQRLELVNRKIYEYEKMYNGTFNQLFGLFSNDEIDASPDSVDIFDWKELEHTRLQLLLLLK